MLEHKGSDTSEHLRVELLNLFAEFETILKNEDLRPKVLHLVKAFRSLRRLGVSVMPPQHEHREAARERILLYLRRYVCRIISGDEILVVSGIQEYARRLRELREQFGWRIVSGTVVKEMVGTGDLPNSPEYTHAKADDYLLLSVEQDRESAFRWHLVNKIRNRKDINIKTKILEFLLENVGVPVSGEELRKVANGTTEWARRVRELRTEEGWPIVTKQTGRPDLPIGVYVLEQNRQGEQHDRKIPDGERVKVLHRDSYRCQKCG